MSFASGLSGVAAANKDLKITGNNIANASTTGFKASRAEFGDAYTTSILGMGTDPIGSGVNVNNVGQKFEQGNISQTNSVLDLAIDGNGFFVTEYPNNSVSYTRSGIFGVNKEGYIVSNQGATLQGFGVNQNGIVSGILQDLRVDAGNQPPRGTHNISARLNVPAGAQVLQQVGSTTTTNGLAVGVAQVGPPEDVVTTLDPIGVPTTAGTAAQLIGGPIGFSGSGITFPWQPNGTEASSTLNFVLQGPNIEGGTTPLSATIQPFSDTVLYSDVNDLVASINANINGDPNLAGKIVAVANAFGGITFETAGTYATDGTAIIDISDNVGTLSSSTFLNFGGAGVTTLGTQSSGLNIVAADTASVLTGGRNLTALDSAPFFAAEGGNTLAFNVNVGSTVYNETFTFAGGGYADLNAFATALNTAPLTAPGSFSVVSDRLVFTANGDPGPNGISITSVPAGTTSAITMRELGLTSNSLIPPTLALGQAQNNELNISINGAAPVNATLAANNYADHESLLAAVNAALAVAGLDTDVRAYHVNGALHFTGVDASVTSIAVTSNTGLSDEYLGIATTETYNTPQIIAPVAGTELFANNGFIDLTSDPGASATVQGNNTAQLTFNELIPGTNTRLISGVQVATQFTPTNFASADAGSTMEFLVNLGGISRGVSLVVPGPAPTAGWDDVDGFRTDLENAINAEFSGDYGPNAVSTSIDASGRLVISANDLGVGPQTISITDLGTTTSNLATLSLATNSTPLPTVTLGQPEQPFNNQLQIAIDGGPMQMLAIPPTTYATFNELTTAVRDAIRSNPVLAGEVNVSHVNGRLVFERSEIGAFPTDISVSGTTDSLEGFGLTSSTKTLGSEPIDRSHSFRINLSVPLPDEEGRSGSVAISLDEVIYSVDQLAAAINRELAAVPEDDYIGVRAVVGRDENDREVIQLIANEAGEASQISITNIQAPGEDLDIEALYALLQADPFDSELLTIGEPAVTNGYPEQNFVLYDEKNDVRTPVNIPEGTQASVIASTLTSLPGVTATAATNVRVLAEDFANGGDMNIFVNGQIITANTFQGMVDEINSYSATSLNSISADLDPDTGDILINSSIGIDISVAIESPNQLDGFTIQGAAGTAPITLGRGGGSEATNARIGGSVDIVLNEGYTMIEPDPRVAGLFNGLNDASFEPFILNAFDPADPETYNETASLTIYDSLGNQHRLQLYYVKDPDDPVRPQALNSWTVYAQIDGQNVGDPDASLPFPDNIEPTFASFKLFFNADGTLDEENTGEFLISNWDPIDETGESNGAYTSLNVAEGGRLPIPDPNTNSNFAVRFDGTTQYGGPFARYDFQQDGYASGRLKDLEIAEDGVIYARYTNGEAQMLGQVALASFANMEGLTPVGQTEWQESFESGDATIGEPGTGLLGTLRSAALEDSTVDLAEQLVHLIIAQRNYQASAKTIETANAVTQTIINLR